MQQTDESGGSQQASIAKPYYHIKSPFPLELDRRFVDQNKGTRMALQRRRQKTPSESVRCCKYEELQCDLHNVNKLSPPHRLGNTIYSTCGYWEYVE